MTLMPACLRPLVIPPPEQKKSTARILVLRITRCVFRIFIIVYRVDLIFLQTPAYALVTDPQCYSHGGDFCAPTSGVVFGTHSRAIASLDRLRDCRSSSLSATYPTCLSPRRAP